MVHLIFEYTQNGEKLEKLIDKIFYINEKYKNATSSDEFASFLDSLDNGQKHGEPFLVNLQYCHESDSLYLDGHLTDLNEKPINGVHLNQNPTGKSVWDEGSDILDKYGLEIYPELGVSFISEFGKCLVKDSGKYQVVMAEFFLQNMPDLSNTAFEKFN